MAFLAIFGVLHGKVINPPENQPDVDHESRLVASNPAVPSSEVAVLMFSKGTGSRKILQHKGIQTFPHFSPAREGVIPCHILLCSNDAVNGTARRRRALQTRRNVVFSQVSLF